MPKQVFKIVDLNGTFRKKFDNESEEQYRKNLQLHQREIMVIFLNGQPAVYSYWTEVSDGDEKLGSMRGKFSLSHNPALGLRRWKWVHDFTEIEGAVPISASPHIYTGAGNKKIRMWDYTIDLGVDGQGNPFKPNFIDEISVGRSVTDMLYVEENGLLYTAHSRDPQIIEAPTSNSLTSNSLEDLTQAFRICKIENCAYCQVEGILCTGCRSGFSLGTDKTKCFRCSDPNTDPTLCQSRRPWDIV